MVAVYITIMKYIAHKIDNDDEVGLCIYIYIYIELCINGECGLELV